METMYLLVNVNSTLAFDFNLDEMCINTNICENWYTLNMLNDWYWLLKIDKANKNLVLDVLFNQPEKYLKNAIEFVDANVYKEASTLVKKHALGLIKPEYYEISDNFAEALIFDYNNQ